MFSKLSFSPRHQVIIREVYGNGKVDEQKLSYLIHYLKSKIERIPKVLVYIKERTKKEMESSGKIKVSAHVITEIINELLVYSTNYETEVLRIFISVIKSIVKLKRKKKFVYKDQEDFLLLVDLFFSKVEIRKFRSEKHIQKILRIITIVIENIEITGRYHEPEIFSEESDGGVRVPREEDVEYSSSDESSSVFHYDHGKDNSDNEIEFDYLFLRLISSVIKVRDLFHNNYSEKYDWIINCVIRPEDINQTKRRDILVYLTKTTNIINSPCFIYLTLLYSSKLNISLMNILTENLPRNALFFVVIDI
jgi:hypothetical protein